MLEIDPERGCKKHVINGYIEQLIYNLIKI